MAIFMNRSGSMKQFVAPECCIQLMIDNAVDLGTFSRLYSSRSDSKARGLVSSAAKGDRAGSKPRRRPLTA